MINKFNKKSMNKYNVFTRTVRRIFQQILFQIPYTLKYTCLFFYTLENLKDIKNKMQYYIAVVFIMPK